MLVPVRARRDEEEGEEGWESGTAPSRENGIASRPALRLVPGTVTFFRFKPDRDYEARYRSERDGTWPTLTGG